MARPDVVAAYGDALSRFRELARVMDSAEFPRPTGCPGWSVQDHVSHVAGVEHAMAGDARPKHVVDPRPEHVRSDFGAAVEVDVDYRRSWTPDAVAGDLDSIIARRLDWLGSADTSDLDAEFDGPFGRTTFGSFFRIRALDVFMHEQDIRRATGRVEKADSPAAVFCVDFVLRRWSQLIPEEAPEIRGRRVRAVVDGSSWTLDYTGDQGLVLADESRPTDATLTFDVAGLMACAGGRSDIPDVAWAGPDGAAETARLVVANAGFTP